MMNAETAAAGLDAIRYANPDGLDEPAQHSSAADVARLARDLMQDPAFRSIVAVVLGAPTEQARDAAARALLDHGFSVA
jgi:D-alanyl-D-alanine carboxypeptidase